MSVERPSDRDLAQWIHDLHEAMAGHGIYMKTESRLINTVPPWVAEVLGLEAQADR